MRTAAGRKRRAGQQLGCAKAEAPVVALSRQLGTDLRVEHQPVVSLVPAARNARTHSPAQVDEIARSIRAFGWTSPVLVDEAGGVIAGHGRLMAAQKLGLKSVPTIPLSGLSDAERRAYLLADNRLALNAGWDDDLLAAEVTDLASLGIALSLAGFADAEIASLVDRHHAGEAASYPDEAPEPPAVPVTRAGDVWLLPASADAVHPHRLVCGDALIHGTLRLALSTDAPAAMIFTDPPYNVSYQGGTARKRTIRNDSMSGAAFAAFLEQACTAMLPLCAGAVYICMSSSELATLRAAFAAAGGHWSTFIIWSKAAFTLGRSDYQRQYEPILYGWREGTRRHWCGDRDQGDVWSYPKPRVNDLHPTMKPVALVERAIRNSSRRGDVVLDPFAGSGTTLMAAEASGRRAALVELDPVYCDVIVSRYADATGRTAMLDGDGRSFGEVMAERLAAASEGKEREAKP